MSEPEFDVDPDDAERPVDEDLPQPHRREHPRLRRASGPVLALTLLAALVAGVVTIRNQSGDDPNAAVTRTVSAPPASSTGRAVPPPDPSPGGSTPSGSNDPAACAPGGSCNTFDTVPASVLTAVRTIFPQARQRYATTVLMHRDGPGSHLRFRQLNASGNGARIFLQVREPRPSDNTRSFADDDGHARHIFVQTRSHGYVVELYIVQVQQFGPQADETGLRTVQRLASDRRLLATA